MIIRSRSRTGNRSQNRGRNRSLNHYASRVMDGARRLPRPNELAIACRLAREVFRSHKRLMKLMPEYFDYAEIDRAKREAEQQHRLQEILTPLLNKIYGPSPPVQDPNLNPTPKSWSEKAKGANVHASRRSMRRVMAR